MFELKTLTDYSDEALLAELRRVASEFKGKRLTREEFSKLSRTSPTTLSRHFGSWEKALDRAGISAELAPRVRAQVAREAVINEICAYISEVGTSPKLDDIAARLDVHPTTISHKFGKWSALLKEVGVQPVPLGKRYTDEDCFDNIVELWTHYARQPNFHELNRPPSRVGSKAYVRRWGGWRAALGAFITYVNQSPSPSQGSDSDEAELERPVGPISIAAVPSDPRSISLALRYKVLCRDRFRCQICGRSPANDIGVEIHVDHIVPWSKGGKNLEQNLRVLCFDCNLGKGAKDESI
jgi:hypothetical protein